MCFTARARIDFLLGSPPYLSPPSAAIFVANEWQGISWFSASLAPKTNRAPMATLLVLLHASGGGGDLCECADLFTCDSRRRTSQFPSRIINIRRAPLPTTLKVQAPAAPSRRPNQRAHRKYVHKSSFTEASEEMITAQETTPHSRLESYYFCRWSYFEICASQNALL